MSLYALPAGYNQGMEPNPYQAPAAQTSVPMHSPRMPSPQVLAGIFVAMILSGLMLIVAAIALAIWGWFTQPLF
ncbi:MAG: hypothetical protein L0211_02480 [Planctomycetaceae bacterium]|nr:hypothetical protein [Planctomycetaceae bacterium]